MTRQTAAAPTNQGWLAAIYLLLFTLVAGARQPEPAYPLLEAKLLKEPRQVIAEAQQIHQTALESGDQARQLTSLHLLALGFLALEQDAELLKVAKTGERLAGIETNDVYLSEFKHFKAIVLEKQGHLGSALEHLNSAIALATRNGNEELIAQHVSGRGRFHLYRENFDLALEDFLRAHDIYEKYHDRENLGLSYNDLAVLYESTGEYAKAIEYHLRAASFGDPDDRYDTVVTHLNLGSAYTGLGDFQRAEEELKRTQQLARQIQDQTSLAYASYWLGEIRSKQQRYSEALVYFREALDLFESNPDALMLFNCHIELAIHSIPLYDYVAARQHLVEAEGFYRTLQTPGLQLNLLQTRAKFYTAMEDYERASETLAQQLKLQGEIYDVEKEENLEKLKLRFHTTQKEQENTILQQKNTVQELQLKKNQTEGRFLMMAIASIIVMLLVTYLAYLRQRKIKRQMETLALTDELTGVANRRHILDIAQQELARIKRYETSLSLAVVDLDHFKQVNDRFGHDVGDRVLQQFCAIFTDIIRIQDTFGRMGGEEWLAVFPHTDPAEVIAILERVRIRYAKAPVLGVSSATTLTFSAGITAATARDKDLDTVLKRADNALYQAKAGGRDRCVLDTNLPPSSTSQTA